MKQSIHFMYDGKSSKDMGVAIASTKKGLFEESFLPDRTINEKTIANREKPYLQGVEHKPLSFSMSIFIDKWEDNMTLRKIARWLFQDYYKPLTFDSNPNRIFYAMFEGDSTLIHNGGKEGYIEFNVRCDSPYGYTSEHSLNNIKNRSSNVGTIVSDDIKSFDNGIHDNTITADNGLTIDNPVMSLERFYELYKKWGELD